MSGNRNHKKISVLIRCYNEEQHIGRLLSGIIQQTIVNPEIILVDSGSDDATLSIASRFPVKIVRINANDFSFGRSLNLGCNAASGEIIVIASAHVYPMYRDWLEKLVRPFDDEDVAVVYGKQRGDHTTKFSEQRILETWFGEESICSQSHPFCNNANAAIRRSFWEELPYDETLSGLEDVDWAMRAMRRGQRIVYCAESLVCHIHNETWERIYHRYRREAVALKIINPVNHFSFWDFCRLLTVSILHDCRHALRHGVLLKNCRSVMLFRLMQFWGTFRGFSQQGNITNELKQKFYYPQGVSPKNRDDAAVKGAAPFVDYSSVEGTNR